MRLSQEGEAEGIFVSDPAKPVLASKSEANRNKGRNNCSRYEIINVAHPWAIVGALNRSGRLTCTIGEVVVNRFYTPELERRFAL
jgi:hypothetical protein